MAQLYPLACIDPLNTAPHIIPPAPRPPTQRRVLRRRRAYSCTITAIFLALLTLIVGMNVFPTTEREPILLFVVCTVSTVAMAVLALVFRFTEKPVEVVVTDWPYKPPVIHLR